MNLCEIPTPSLLAEIQRRCEIYQVVPVWADPTLAEVAATFGISVASLIAPGTRIPGTQWPRFVAIAVLRDRKPRSHREIGAIFGVTHGAAAHAIRRVHQRRETDPEFSKKTAHLFFL